MFKKSAYTLQAQPEKPKKRCKAKSQLNKQISKNPQLLLLHPKRRKKNGADYSTAYQLHLNLKHSQRKMSWKQ
jgi:hypothetical protein